MANTEKDIDKILENIKKRKTDAGGNTPVQDSFAGLSVQQRDSVLIKSIKTVELKKAAEQQRASALRSPVASSSADRYSSLAKQTVMPLAEMPVVADVIASVFSQHTSSASSAVNSAIKDTPVEIQSAFSPSAKDNSVTKDSFAERQASISSAVRHNSVAEQTPTSSVSHDAKVRSKADINQLINEIKGEKSRAAAGVGMPKAPVGQSSAPTPSHSNAQRSVDKPVQAVAAQSTVSASATPKHGGYASKLDNEDFLSKLATVLNDTPQDAPLHNFASAAKPKESQRTTTLSQAKPPIENKPLDKLTFEDIPLDNDITGSETVQSIIDDKFVDFFTQSVVVPHVHDDDISIMRKSRGFFKKKYITDSLSLSVSEEDIKKAERAHSTKKKPLAKAKTQDLVPPPSTIFSREISDSNADKGALGSASESSAGTIYHSANTAVSEDTAYLPTHKTTTDVVSDITAMFQAKDDSIKSQSTYSKPKNEVAEAKELSQPPVFEEYLLDNEFAAQYVKEDPAEILKELGSFKSTLTARVLMAFICSAVLLYLNFAANLSFPLPGFMSPTAQPLIFYVVTLVFYAIVLIGFLPTLANGFIGIFKNPTSDSYLSLCGVLCLLQINLSVIGAQKIDPKTNTIFAGFLVLALGFNALGKLICANTISRNLSLSNVPDGINAGYTIKDPDAVKKLSRTLEEKSPQILVSRKTGVITNFISGGFSAHKSEKNSKMVALFTYAVTLVCFFLGLYTSKDFSVAIFTATGASALMLPLSHTLISSIPSSLMQKSLKQVGALVNGWQGIDQLSKTTHVSFDAKHLFPKGSVVLHGIKTFEKERLDHAILYAASIAIEKCDNLRPVFMNVIENKTDMLFPLESCEYKVGQGYIAWIEHNRVIMGNRNIMSQFDIELPPVSLETRFTAEGKKPIYLSVNGKLFGMFIVSYHPDSSVKENLDRLISNGVNVILQSTDFNIDSQLLELVYNLPTDTVQVLNQNETALLLNYTQYSEKTESCVAHLDSLYSLVAGFCGADSAKAAAATCSIVQTVSIVIGAILAVMFSYSQTMPSVPLLSVLFLGFGWMGLCLMRALAKKYY